MAFNMNSVGIPERFRGSARFSARNLGLWGGFGRFEALLKAFVQITI